MRIGNWGHENGKMVAMGMVRMLAWKFEGGSIEMGILGHGKVWREEHVIYLYFLIIYIN